MIHGAWFDGIVASCYFCMSTCTSGLVVLWASFLMLSQAPLRVNKLLGEMIFYFINEDAKNQQHGKKLYINNKTLLE